MMKTKWFIGAILVIVLMGSGLAPLHAQTGPMLTLSSADPAAPVQFQALKPGESPVRSAFTDRLDIASNPDKLLVYVILQNTGWSEGTLGLVSSALAPDKTYVALEVQQEGDQIVLSKGGLAFKLDYQANLDGSGTPGFQLHLLVDQRHAFAIYQVVDTGGVSFTGKTNLRAASSVTQTEADYQVAAEPVFGAVVLECHIAALVVQSPAATPAPTPVAGPEIPVPPPHPYY